MSAAGELQVIGAGLPRTGTTSLKAGLELLLGGPCYHMFELMQRREEDDGVLWWAALDGDLDALDKVVHGWAAAVDWPSSLFWRELAERHPNAHVVLSHRGSADTWWQSVDATVWNSMRDHGAMPVIGEFNVKMRTKAGLGDDWADESVAKRYYERQIDEVTATIDPDRLIIWEPSQGWGPLCDGLGLPVPAVAFGHHNTRAEFVARVAENERKRAAEAARTDAD